MKRKTKFMFNGALVLLATMLSWYIIQRFYIGPAKDNLFLSILSLIGHGFGIWFVYGLLASRFNR
jgi:hypothetical protein